MPRKTKESKVVPALPVSTRCRLTRPSSGRPRAGFAPFGRRSCPTLGGNSEVCIKLLIFVVGWCILFALAWPPAVLVLALAPLIWLLSLPLLVVGICVTAVFALVKSVLFLPARLLGYRG